MSSSSDVSYDPTQDEELDSSNGDYTDEGGYSSGDDHEDFTADDTGHERPSPDSDWYTLHDPFVDSRPIKRPPFTGVHARVSPNAGNFGSPLSAFLAFFDDTLMESICEWTNARADQFF